MSIKNLIAYIPTLCGRHMQWFKRHQNSMLYLLSEERVIELDGRIRHIDALSSRTVLSIISNLDGPGRPRDVGMFEPENLDPCLTAPSVWPEFILPDEDISHALVKKYFANARATAKFEDIHARWDMAAIDKGIPKPDDIPVTYDPEHNRRMDVARAIAPRSPDWWRQVGAALYINGVLAAEACNEHFPYEYEQDLHGDPRASFNAGQPGRYLSLHAEKGSIFRSGRKGIATEGGDLYVTICPCEDCAKAIVVAGIKRVFFVMWYSAMNALDIFRAYGVELIQVRNSPE